MPPSSSPPLSIPLISLSPSKSASVLAEEVSNACKTSGFLYITDHGIPQEQIDRAFKISSEFFEGEEQGEKEKVGITVGNKGWTQVRQESLDPSTAKKGDLHESFYFSKFAPDGTPDQPLPPTFAVKQKELAAFFEATHDLCLRILSSFALSLSLPPNFFDALHPGVSDRLRFLHYPPHIPTSNEQDARSGAHSDYGSVTILFQHEVGGLQVLLPSSSSSNNEETWVEAPIIPNALLVNVGDAFEFWSSGLFRSTVHRVPLPSEEAPRRYSIAYFCQPGDDVVLKSLIEGGVKEEDEERWREIMGRKGLLKDDGTVVEKITAGEHLQMRLAGSYKGRKEE